LLASCAADLLPAVAREDLTFFEAATALAFLAFARSSVELAIVEVGLGGRLDATNVVSPVASAVTNVDLDHAEYLGDTLEAVAREKAGILKPGVPAVLGPVPDRILPVFEERARAVGTTLRLVGRDVVVESVETGSLGTSFTYRGPGRAEGTRLSVPLAGAHQAINAAVAVAMLDAAGRTPDTLALSEGLASVRWPGRFQILRRSDGTWLLDVAHNPAGVRALADALGQVDLPHPRVCLVAILGDKPWREMLDPVLRNATAAVLTVAPSSPVERRWDPSEARAAVSGHVAHVEPDFDRALVLARELAGSGTVVVTGSCHTVGDALVRLGVSAA
jgi:dihydrofolate synthase/folylpolyglutamate synthase